ncbi:MAG: hypothetical protein JXB13_08780 [Phycisphaerae bacterium]|nr:hypothetical protein [Phycisphaerae bacterium]
MWALVWIALAHGLVSRWLLTNPLPHAFLRYKVLKLTEDVRPEILIAGDSRAERQLIPERLAAAGNLAPQAVVNIAQSACESCNARAAYMTFADRFAKRPIVLLSVSVFSVNDRASHPGYLSDGMLWSVGLADRFRMVPISRALRATFLPERTGWARLAERWGKPWTFSIPNQGFVDQAGSAPLALPPEEFRRLITEVDRHWFNEARIDGARWQQLEADLTALIETGAQLVLFDGPDHPDYVRAVACTPAGRVLDQFDARIRALADRLGVPLLQYAPDWLGDRDPDALFKDFMHVNVPGAELLSERVGQDLRRLLETGRLQPPG